MASASLPGKLGTLRRLWAIRAPVVVTVRATPQMCLAALAAAASPSGKRLHLRNLYGHGQRYYLEPLADGFKLVSTSRHRWRYRHRTPVSTIAIGRFNCLSDDITQIHLRVRFALRRFFLGFLIPLYFGFIIFAAPWPRWFVGLAIGILIFLAWVERWFAAALQAENIIYFVHKVLGEFTIEATPLADGNAAIITPNEFTEAWERFYGEHAALPAANNRPTRRTNAVPPGD